MSALTVFCGFFSSELVFIANDLLVKLYNWRQTVQSKIFCKSKALNEVRGRDSIKAPAISGATYKVSQSTFKLQRETIIIKHAANLQQQQEISTRFLFWRWCNRSSRRHCLESSFRSAALHFTASVLITSMKRNRIDMFGICYVVDIDNEKQNVFLSHSLASFAFNNRNRLLFNCSTSGFQKQFTKCFVYLINYIRTQASENDLWLEIGSSERVGSWCNRLLRLLTSQHLFGDRLRWVEALTSHYYARSAQK